MTVDFVTRLVNDSIAALEISNTVTAKIDSKIR
jgi:hypothetical protein